MSRKLTSAAVVIGAALLASCQFVPGTDENEIQKVERLIAAQMSDPEATQFSEMDRRFTTDANGQVFYAVCGKFNTKNLMGAYVGYQRFVHFDGQTLIDPQVDVAAAMASDTARLERCNDAMSLRLARPGPAQDMRVEWRCAGYNPDTRQWADGSTEAVEKQMAFDAAYLERCQNAI